MEIRFNDEQGIERSGEVEREFFVGEQKWNLVSVDGVNWLVPTGWPNNASAFCEETDPEAFAEFLAKSE